MFGEMARGWTIEIANYKGALLAILPPGAFMGLGSIIAVKNYIDKLRKERVRKEVAVGDDGEVAAT
jgi:electron transport complex protein RnfE